MLKDTNSSFEDCEICLAIFSPHRSKLTSHRGYDINQLKDKFRSIYVIKSRYGESDVEDFIYYDGKCNKWVEMPRAADINDYGIFDNPKWYEDNVKGIEFKDEKQEIKSKFIL